MPVFQYSAVNANGQVERGLLQGVSLESVAAKLTERGMTVQEIAVAPNTGDPLAEQPAPKFEPRSKIQTEVIGPVIKLVSLADLQFFFRQLSTMLEAGINPAQTLETIGRQTQSGQLREILGEAKTMVTSGHPMSAAFQRYPEVFSPLMMSLVRAGERGGFLPEAASNLSEYIREEIELRNLIKRETAYPKMVIAASIFIILGTNAILGMIAPKAGGLSSPLTTPANWLCLGPLLLGIFIFVKFGLRNQQVQRNWQMFLQSLPGFGGMVHGFAMAKFGRAFGALYKGGVPLPEAVTLAADSCGSEYTREKIYPAAQQLQNGEGITDAFASTGAFSAIVLDMTRTGEMTGNLDQMLIKVAEYYEDEGKTKAKQWATFFGVFVFLCVAVYVGFIVVTFFMGYASGITQATQ